MWLTKYISDFIIEAFTFTRRQPILKTYDFSKSATALSLTH